MNIEENLKNHQIELEDASTPAGNYVPYIITNKLVFISGQLPFKQGKIPITGVGVRGDETTHKVASRGFVRRELKVVSGGGADNVSILQTKNYLDTYENEITDINDENETNEVLVKQNSTISKEIEAKIKGFEGEACGECGNFTLVRNGTCMNVIHVVLLLDVLNK